MLKNNPTKHSYVAVYLYFKAQFPLKFICIASNLDLTLINLSKKSILLANN
jgi:hypothetical protein